MMSIERGFNNKLEITHWWPWVVGPYFCGKFYPCKKASPLMNNSSSLWVRILLSKYGGLHPWFNSPKQNCSWSWRNISKFSHRIRGFTKLIGTCPSSSIWDDPWVDSTPFSKWSTLLNMDEMLYFSNVPDLIHQN